MRRIALAGCGPQVSTRPSQRATRAAGRAPVDMRIGAVGGEQVGVRDHRVRHVDVQVERSDDRRVRPDNGADPPQQLALGVVVARRRPWRRAARQKITSAPLRR